MDELYKRIGRRIRRLRRSRNLLQEDLAVRARLSRGSISNIEAGRQQLYLHHLVAIADALNEAPAELLSPDVPADDNKQRFLDAARAGTTARAAGRNER